MTHNHRNAPGNDGNDRKNVNDMDDPVVDVVYRFRLNVKPLAAT